MKPFRLPQLAWLAPLLAFCAAAALVRADDPPAPPAQPDQPAAVAPEAAPTVSTPPAETAAPEKTAAPEAAVEAAEAAREQAEKVLAEAEAAAERARAAAEKARDEARAAAERARDEARAAAEKAREESRAAVQEVQEQVSKIKRAKRTHTSNDGDRVIVGDDNVVPAGVVVENDAVAVMGNLTVHGEVKNDAVAVMGDNTINGTVHGNVVAVMGNITLGPQAVVDGNLTCVMGEIHRDPGAVVKGRTEVQAIGPNIRPASIMSYWEHALKLGRPLAVGAHLAWLWIITAFSIAFYALLGLIFPRKITACGDKLVQEPFLVILSGVLGVLALPVLFILLCITIIGIPVALLVLPVGTLLVAMFGKAAIYALVGRKLTGDRFAPVLAVLIGAGVFILLYLVPFLGLLLTLLVWFLGFGCAVLLMFSRSDAAKAKPAAAPAATAPFAPSASAAASASTFVAAAAPIAAATAVEGSPQQSAGFGATEVPPAAEPPPAAAPRAAYAAPAPVILSADTLPRATFWIRTAAALLDFFMIMVPLGIAGGLSEGPGLMFLIIAAYHAVMWHTKGTTVGGAICGLKVVRLDDRPIEWGVAIVRALTAFLSLFVFGLGFIWVAFDEDKQSWHDKIAGTTIVKVPKGTPLI